MNKDTAFSVIVSALGNMLTMLESEESEPVLNQLLIIFNDKAIYDIFLPAVNKIGLNGMKEIMAEVLVFNVNLCLIIALFHVFNDDKDKDKISLRSQVELLQEAFEVMPEDEFLRQADKAVNNMVKSLGSMVFL
jgi:hypothetical protein